MLSRIQQTRKELAARRGNEEYVTRADAEIYNALLAEVQRLAPEDPVVKSFQPAQGESELLYGDLLSWYAQLEQAIPPVMPRTGPASAPREGGNLMDREF